MRYSGKRILFLHMKKLEGKELYRRLQEAKNAKRLHEAAIQRNADLKKQLSYYEKLTANQSKQMKIMREIIQQQGLQLEEFRRIIFGKKKKRKDDDDQNNGGVAGSGTAEKPAKVEKKLRGKSSYQRPVPKNVTETNSYPIDQCQICETHLVDKKTVERFLEDIVLPDEKKNPWKKIEKKLIETGWCPKCHKTRSIESISGAVAQLGPNIRAMVVYLTVVQRQTYSQITNFFRDIAQIAVSDGEIARILAEQAVRAGPERARIEQRISEQKGVHSDETTWKTLKDAEGDYAWAKTGTETFDTIYSLGKSRGKGNAGKVIMAQNPDQTGISDDYAAYDNAFAWHELCWSHPLRKLRDLSESMVIPGKSKLRCIETFLEFKKLYADAEKLRNESIPFEKKNRQKSELMRRFVSLAQPKKFDPKKLQTIKTTLISKRENYFVWLEKEGIPLDNNKAERALRSLVIKRKISFGSKTAKGAENLGILFSVVMSLWWKRPANFFSAYADLLA